MSVLFTGVVKPVPFYQFSLAGAKTFFLSHACKVADGKLLLFLRKSRREKNVIISPEKRGKGRVVKEGERRGGT